MLESRAVTVLTTEEHCDSFRAAIGEGADFRFDPYDAMPLHLFLGNLSLSAGGAVVLDEDYFLSDGALLRGLADFLDEPVPRLPAPRIVCVCSRRKAGDALLHRLASYFAIYDIVYDCPVHELGERVARLLVRPNRRVDVLELLAAPGESSAWGCEGAWAGEAAGVDGAGGAGEDGGHGLLLAGGAAPAAATSFECGGVKVEIALNVTPIAKS